MNTICKNTTDSEAIITKLMLPKHTNNSYQKQREYK